MSFLVVNNNGLKNTSYISSYNNVLLSKFRKVHTAGNITSCKVILHVSLNFSVIDEASRGGFFVKFLWQISRMK